MSGQAKATQPEDVTQLVAERLNAGGAAGAAALYQPQAMLAYPAGRPVTGPEAVQAIYQQMADAGVQFALETPLRTVRFEDLALTSTRSADNPGVRVQVLRRQPDGSWAAGHRPARGTPSHSPLADRLRRPLAAEAYLAGGYHDGAWAPRSARGPCRGRWRRAGHRGAAYFRLAKTSGGAYKPLFGCRRRGVQARGNDRRHSHLARSSAVRESRWVSS